LLLPPFAHASAQGFLSDTNYRHWLQIEHDTDGDGNYHALAGPLDPTTKPFVLREEVLPAYDAFNIRIREYRQPVDNSSQAEMVHEDVQAIELNPVGLYAEVFSTTEQCLTSTIRPRKPATASPRSTAWARASRSLSSPSTK
jgi:hypothetical protein